MPLAAAGIGAAGSILGGLTGGKGAAKAAKIQAAAEQQAINEQQREFGVVQANEQPYQVAGTSALGSYEDVLGLGAKGVTGQQTAINNLEASPLYTSQFNSGLQAVDQSEAASGGLRGGDGALAQSDFGSQLLASVLQQYMGNLGGLISTGQSAAGGTNSAALSTGANISNELTAQGGANASGAASPYAAFASALSGLSGVAGKYFGTPNINSGVVGSGYIPTVTSAAPNVSSIIGNNLGYTAPNPYGLF